MKKEYIQKEKIKKQTKVTAKEVFGTIKWFDFKIIDDGKAVNFDIVVDEKSEFL